MGMYETTIKVDGGSGRLGLSAKLRPRGDDLILFVHGLGCAKESFDDAFKAERLREFSICTFDFPAHGDSEALDDSRYTLESLAEILVGVTKELTDQLSARRIYLVGHSMGGAVSVIAAQEIGALAGFVSVEGNLVAEDCGLISRSIAEQRPEAFAASGFEQFVDRLRRSGGRDTQAWATWAAACEPVGLNHIARSLVSWSENGKLLDLFLSLRDRSYVYGARSDVAHLWERMPQVGTRRIARSGHFPMIDNPAAFYKTVADVAAGVPDRSPIRRRISRLTRV